MSSSLKEKAGGISHLLYASSHHWPAALLILTLIALLIRLWGLNYHSLWFDEAVSVFWARQPLGETLRVGLLLDKDKHPPLFYLVLHGWIALFGDGPVSVRLPSVLLGAALPPALAILGAELRDRSTGLLAGVLASLNPMLVWYSQEVRMFGPAATLVVIATLCLLRGLRRQAWGWWIGYILTAVAGVYTYLFVALILPFHGFMALGEWLRAREEAGRRLSFRSLWPAAFSFLLVAIFIAPLAFQALFIARTESTPGQPFEGILPTLWNLLGVYTVRQPPWPALAIILITAGSLALLTLGVALPPARWRQAVGSWLLLPPAIGGLLLVLNASVFAETRYYLFLAPAMCLAWAGGLVWLSRKWRAAGFALTAVWAVVALTALPYLWTPESRREEWRGAAQYIAEHAGPEDAILIHPAYVRLPFLYYYPFYFSAHIPVFHPFEGVIADESQIDAPLQGLTGYHTVWLVSAHEAGLDPDRRVRSWFESRYPQVTEQFPAGVTVKGFATQYRFDRLPPRALPRDDSFAGGVQLRGYRAHPLTLPAREELYHPPSNWIHVTMYMSAQNPITESLGVTLLMIDHWGQVWGERLYLDGETLNFHPTTAWLPEEIVRLEYDVNLNPATPAGSYFLVLGLIDEAGGSVRPLSGDNDWVILSAVTIVD